MLLLVWAIFGGAKIGRGLGQFYAYLRSETQLPCLIARFPTLGQLRSRARKF